MCEELLVHDSVAEPLVPELRYNMSLDREANGRGGPFSNGSQRRGSQPQTSRASALRSVNFTSRVLLRGASCF